MNNDFRNVEADFSKFSSRRKIKDHEKAKQAKRNLLRHFFDTI